MTIYQTPWRINSEDLRVLEILDANDNVVLAFNRVCWSSKWKSQEDIDNLTGIRPADREEWGTLLQDQSDSIKALVSAVNEKYAPVGELTFPTDVTKEDLEEAIISVLGEKRYNGLGGDDEMTLCHEKACMVAFLNKLEGPKIDLLRGLYEYVSMKGVYPFYDAPKP